MNLFAESEYPLNSYDEPKRRKTLAKVTSMTLPAVLLALVLHGCQSLDELDRANYQRSCDNLGIQQGTPEYDQCMLQQQRMDNDNVQRTIDRAEEAQLLKKL